MVWFFHQNANGAPVAELNATCAVNAACWRLAPNEAQLRNASGAIEKQALVDMLVKMKAALAEWPRRSPGAFFDRF